MPDQLVETKRTPITPLIFAQAVLRAHPDWSIEAVGVLYAHYALETGAGGSCWNWNLGNVKYTKGCGYDYVALVRNKEATPGGVYYETAKSNPASWFRAYPSFDAGMKSFIDSKTTGQWASTLPYILSGDHAGYARELKNHYYYTAPLADYQKLIKVWFDRWMKMGAYEEAAETIPPPPPDTTPDFGVVYAMPDPPKRDL